MTDTVKNIQVGSTVHPVEDTKATPLLTSTDETTLLTNGTYRGSTIANNSTFVKKDGTLNNFVDDAAVAWTHTTGNNSGYGWKILYTGQAFLGFMGDFTTGIKRSTNGTTWSNVSMPGSYSQRWYVGLAADGEGVVIAKHAANSNQYARSTDHGLTWTMQTLPASWSAREECGSYANGVFFIGRNGDYYYSTDKALTWTLASFPTWYISSVIYVAPYYFALGEGYTGFNGIYQSSSPEGPWTKINSTKVHTMTTDGSTIVALTNSSPYSCIYSSDKGATWSTVALPVDEKATKILYANGLFFGYSSTSNKFVYSTDAITWKQGSTNLSAISSGAAAGADCFVGSYSNTSVKSVYGITHTYSLTPLSYTKSEVDTALASKQGTLTAGNGIDITSDTISAEEMVGADGVNIGKAGAVPRPAATDNTKFLRGDGTWAEVGGTSYNPSAQEITLG